jgi:phage/plasmid-associated DNA primase
VEIVSASREYLKSESILSVFIEDECEVSEFEFVTFVELYKKLESWCEENGYDLPSRKAISSMLTSLGYATPAGGKRMIKGLRIKPSLALRSGSSKDWRL